ncbi:MAG: hypothetical protein HYU48_00100 [Candidatus Levybacteria bacterium]|nr:hypothetical protein [Candidatus Levybacteria bacterium]
MNDSIGKVVHYYDKLGVAVVKLDKKLAAGDRVRFEHGQNSFEQTIESMQLDHKPINEGNPGDEVAVKVDKKANEGTVLLAV